MGQKIGPDFDQKWVIFNIDSLLETMVPDPFLDHFLSQNVKEDCVIVKKGGPKRGLATPFWTTFCHNYTVLLDVLGQKGGPKTLPPSQPRPFLRETIPIPTIGCTLSIVHS